ncbi:MAG: response regulator [Rhizobacter sp.]|nr:response regulator [Rhizobacter sp.]
MQGYVNITRDLSEQRRLEDLEAEGKRVYEFIAMLSHELRNPLAPIQHAVQILEHPRGQQQLAKYTAMIARQVTQLRRLVDDLLEVSRITTGKIRIERAHVEVNTVAQVATDSVRSILEARGHELDVALAPQPVFVDGDAVRLTQVLVNLLNNAVTYTQPKGRIELAVHRNHSVVRIEVSDNGIGMSEALMQRAFEPFTQGERALDRPEGGLGMGLTLVKRIVELHGGTVVVASAGTGKGTRFTVTLPLINNGEQSLAAVKSQPSSPTGKVLVVDDNRDAAEALSELLRVAGHEVVCAFTGQEALDLAEKGGFAAVLLDIGLPDMSGYEVARRLRQVPVSEGVQIIATTGYGLDTDKEASAQAGFDAHLVKPVDYNEVLRLLAA